MRAVIELLCLIQKQLILEYLVLCREQVLFVGLAFLDDGATLADLTVLAGDLLLRAYPLAEFIIEHAARVAVLTSGDPQRGAALKRSDGYDSFLCLVMVEG